MWENQAQGGGSHLPRLAEGEEKRRERWEALRLLVGYIYLLFPTISPSVTLAGIHGATHRISYIVTYLDSPICLVMVFHCEQLSPIAVLRGGYVYSTVWKQI